MTSALGDAREHFTQFFVRSFTANQQSITTRCIRNSQLEADVGIKTGEVDGDMRGAADLFPNRFDNLALTPAR